MDESIEFLGALLLVVALVVGACAWVADISCAAKWSRSGFESDYGIIQGCVIKVNGRWIPEERYRDFDE